jgi:uncharacterized membrane protein HdeD (DUF308 family)
LAARKLDGDALCRHKKEISMASTHSVGTALRAQPLLHALARNWWVFLLRGLSALALGVLAFVWPGLTFVTLVLVFGLYALADGVLAIIGAITGHTQLPRWWLLIVGIAGLAAGAITLIEPGLAAAALLIVIGAWAIASGAMQIIGAIQLRKEIENEWLLILGGVCSVIFGAIVLLRPLLGGLALIYTIGFFATIYGILLIAFSLRLKHHTHTDV